MKVTFLNHSSIRLRFASGLDIVCDPWFESKVFNNSWRLLSEESPHLDELDKNTLIYISHEHPDHLNFPTLKRYFQNQYVLSRNDLRKEIPETLSKIGLGFCGIMPNTIHYLPSGDQIGIFTFYGDSGIYACDGKTGKSIFNFNDCEFTEEYMKQILSIIPSNVSLVAGQFGLAGYYANRDQVEVFHAAKEVKLQRLYSISHKLNAELILPFASYAAFCKEHNSYINKFQTSLQEVRLALSTLPSKIWIPLPNTTIDLSLDISQDYLELVSGEKYWSNLQKRSLTDANKDDLMRIPDLVEALDNLSCICAEKLIQVPSNIPLFQIGMIVNGNILPLEVNLSTFSVAMLPATQTTIFDIPSDELVYAFKYRWGADTLNVTGSANVRSIQGYRYFCQLLDQLLKAAL